MVTRSNLIKFLDILTTWLFALVGMQMTLSIILYRIYYANFIYSPINTPVYIINMQHIFSRATYIGYGCLILFWVVNWKRLYPKIKQTKEFIEQYSIEKEK